MKMKCGFLKTELLAVQRVQFFKDAVTAAKFPQDEEDVHRLIQRYEDSMTLALIPFH